MASLSQWLLGGSRRTTQGGRLLRSAALADQQDGDGHEHRVPIAVEAVMTAAASQVNQLLIPDYTCTQDTSVNYSSCGLLLLTSLRDLG